MDGVPSLFRFLPGNAPVLVNIPHAGTYVPAEIRTRLHPEAVSLPDTDWHLDELYAFTDALDIPVLSATHSRYVVDLNRPPDDKPLYTTATTGLCPATRFDGQPVYQAGLEPSPDEQRTRVEQYWRPYHDRLAAELRMIQARFGFVILFDAHSIRSRIPRLFEGQLPDLNVGTNKGASCSVSIEDQVWKICSSADGISSVKNGRFTGGYITRHYGNPSTGFHAVQMEMVQSMYMLEDPPWKVLPDRLKRSQVVLSDILRSLTEWQPHPV